MLWRRALRALSLACLALAAPLPGVGHLLALTALPARRREEEDPPASGCLHCGRAGHGCDAGWTHWIPRAAAIDAGSDRRARRDERRLAASPG